MSNRSVDRLALISRLLLDERVLELRMENEALRLKLFWKDHNLCELRDLMAMANRAGPDCSCTSCALTYRKRIEKDRQPRDEPCSFKPWFESILADLDMICIIGFWPELKPVFDHDCTDYHVYDVDSHFHHNGQANWLFWGYGSKLWKAKTINDPELQKLKRLFERLKREIHGPTQPITPPPPP